MTDEDCGVTEAMVKKGLKDLDQEEIGLSKLKEDEIAEQLFAYMMCTMPLISDAQPNEGNWHLEEGMTKQDVYKEYKTAWIKFGLEPVRYQRFMNMWAACFSFVVVSNALRSSLLYITPTHTHPFLNPLV